ncbi:MAG TPA: hypothetical protein VFL55_26055, partial [Acetobacteraceae bacterium]|nr:hypothetical protein [Acetobacteraceae bacterium]
DHCIVVGEKWKRGLVETLGVTPHAVSVIHNGVPETTGPRKPQPNGTSFRLLFIGNLLPQKGVADLLQALALPEMRNTLLTLTLAGGGPVDKYKGVVQKVRFPGNTGNR